MRYSVLILSTNVHLQGIHSFILLLIQEEISALQGHRKGVDSQEPMELNDGKSDKVGTTSDPQSPAMSLHHFQLPRKKPES